MRTAPRLPLDPESRPSLARSLTRLPLLVYRALRWRALRGGWLPGLLWRSHRFDRRAFPAGLPLDVMVLIADHFEPARRFGDRAAVEAVRSWCAAYEALAAPHRDSDGRPPRHTWFYRYDYPNDGCVRALGESAFRGFGEVEFHLHHGHDTHESLTATLGEGAAWFRRHGALWTAEARPRTAFAYVAGNSALDNGAGDPSLSGCDTELTALRDAGCYADFTYPALGSPGQPSKTNAIYYATEDGKPKSHDGGVEVAAGRPPSGDLMIFQGPIAIDWDAGYFDDGALEDTSPAHPRRLGNWLAAHVHVAGRPEWVFVKLHTHGMQNRASFLSPATGALFGAMGAWWTRPPFRLHYVTAREAYNIVKAAEAGHHGNPDDYRDFAVPPPANTRVNCPLPWHLLTHTPDAVHVRVLEPGPVRVEFAGRPLRAVSGRLAEVEVRFHRGEPSALCVTAEGPVAVEPLRYARLVRPEQAPVVAA